MQAVTDAATELTRREFGAFFYNVVDAEAGEAYMLYTLSGARREAFANFRMPRDTAVFEPTFTGEGVVRLDDITQGSAIRQERAVLTACRPGHLPVRSYLGRAGEGAIAAR